VELSRIKKGDILITEEVISGMRRLVYGPVVVIDNERGEVGIRVGEDIRSFPSEQLSTIYAFTTNYQTEKPDDGGMRILMGYIISIAEGPVNEVDLHEIAGEFKRQGVKPATSRDVLETVLPK